MCLLLKRRFAPKFVQNQGSRVQKGYFLLTSLKDVAALIKVLPKMVTENGIHLPPMKVISNTILFVYSLRGALIKIVRMCHMRWRNYFDGTNPISCLQSRRS